MIRVVIHKSFQKQFKKAPPAIREKARKRIHLFRTNPYHELLHHHSLGGSYSEYFSINVTGDWRAVYRQLDAEIVEFVYLDTHSHLYG